MLPGSPKRKSNSSKVNLFFSLTFHGLLVFSVLFFAAREGFFGDPGRILPIEILRPDKKPDKPKPEPPKPKPPEADPAKTAQTPKLETPRATVQAPPAVNRLAPPAVAPPPSVEPEFIMPPGRLVQSSTDPVQIYRALLQNTLQYHWDRPRDMDGHTNVAEVEVAVDKAGEITPLDWKKTSGQKQWDDSMRLALSSAKKVSLPPPSNFPSRVVVRFDEVAAELVAE